jgi:hypothetical protein
MEMITTDQLRYVYDFSSAEEFLFFLAGDVMKKFGYTITEDWLVDYNENTDHYAERIFLSSPQGEDFVIVIENIEDTELEIIVDFYLIR